MIEKHLSHMINANRMTTANLMNTANCMNKKDYMNNTNHYNNMNNMKRTCNRIIRTFTGPVLCAGLILTGCKGEVWVKDPKQEQIEQTQLASSNQIEEVWSDLEKEHAANYGGGFLPITYENENHQSVHALEADGMLLVQNEISREGESGVRSGSWLVIAGEQRKEISVHALIGESEFISLEWIDYNGDGRDELYIQAYPEPVVYILDIETLEDYAPHFSKEDCEALFQSVSVTDTVPNGDSWNLIYETVFASTDQRVQEDCLGISGAIRKELDQYGLEACYVTYDLAEVTHQKGERDIDVVVYGQLFLQKEGEEAERLGRLAWEIDHYFQQYGESK